MLVHPRLKHCLAGVPKLQLPELWATVPTQAPPTHLRLLQADTPIDVQLPPVARMSWQAPVLVHWRLLQATAPIDVQLPPAEA